MTVRRVVVQHPQHVVLALLQRQRAQDLVHADRVLDQQDPQLPARHRRPLRAAERRPHALERIDRALQRHAQGARRRRRAERVVDVVEARQREADAGLARRRVQRERGFPDALECHLACVDEWRGRRQPHSGQW